jgi:hypothetical protein
MSAVTSPKAYAALAAFHAVDAVACAVQVPPIKKVLDTVELPENLRPVLPVVKTAAAIGLLSVSRFPGLARLTTAMLTLYFTLALGSHIRVGDKILNALPSASFLVLFATMTVQGPDEARSSGPAR